MPSKLNLAGQRFGRLTVLEEAPRRVTAAGHSFTRWACICDCGNVVVTFTNGLRSGHAKSCGCLKVELSSTRNLKHGQHGAPVYFAWSTMLRRCTDPKTEGYARYGGRGIRVCERWHDFAAFIADMGQRPPGMSIERENNDGNYEPGNCRWATRNEQMKNTRANVSITYEGETMILADWARRFKTSGTVIRRRMAKFGTMHPIRSINRR